MPARTPAPPRLLHRRGIPAYTHNPSQAMTAEPEAITADEQDAITRAAHQHQHDAWHTSRNRLLAEVEHVRAHIKSPHVRRATRALEREIAALDRKLSDR